MLKGSDLQAAARQIFPAVQCRVIVPESSDEDILMSGMNIHVPVVYENGSRLLARIRQSRVQHPPRHIQQLIQKSETTTMKFLRRVDSEIIPQIYGRHANEEQQSYAHESPGEWCRKWATYS